MKDITVIIPILLEHYSHPNDEKLIKAVDSVVAAAKNYTDGVVKLMIVRPEDKQTDNIYFGDKIDTRYIYNDGKTDYCSQINLGASKVDTDYFSILEFDDWYSPKWFKMFNEYYNTHEDVSVFMPINVLHNVKTNINEFVNDAAWASSASSSEELGMVDFDFLEVFASFNLTGSIFKTSDWLKYKPSIKAAFNYEYLLRATSKKQKVYVIPKEGYHHELFREGSLIDKYMTEIPENENPKWFDLAKRECIYDEDREKGIFEEKVEQLK